MSDKRAIKMFKVCRTCLDNLHMIEYPSPKLLADSNVFKIKCALKPTCAGQPERFKKEDNE